MIVYISTQNEVKVNSVKELLKDAEVIIFPDNSGVSDNPYNEDIYLGAKNRVDYLIKESTNLVDLYIGLETGISYRYNKYYIETWCVIYYKHNYYSSYSSGIEIPHLYEQDIIGKTKKEIIDYVYEKSNISQDICSYITNQKITRKDVCIEVMNTVFKLANVL